MGRVGRRQLLGFLFLYNKAAQDISSARLLFVTIQTMDNFRWWAFWRRLVYGSGFLVFWLAVGTASYYIFYNEPATCFDNELNGNESGVDCGGDCVRICTADVLPPQVAWAESFETAPGQYNAVAYIENRNTLAGTPKVNYTFTFKDDRGAVIAQRSGSTVLPPNSSYPVFEGRIFTSNQEIAETELTIDRADLWQPATSNSGQFATVDVNLMNVDVKPRLDVKMQNNSVLGVSDVEVVATIFNDLGEPVAASQTFVENFAPSDTQDVVFTWPNSIAKTVRSCTIPTDVVLGIDLSGSMNNDQDSPPQPVTDALLAAGSFVEKMGKLDQIGVVTFATEAALVQPLTDLHSGAVDVVKNLTIAAESETGFTNTSDAIQTATVELSSERHNESARRAFVILTDGLPTDEGDQTDPEVAAIAAARTLSDSGADVYAIGLGTNVNQQFIRALASAEAHAYLAPSSGDLTQIYDEITASLCEVGPTKIEVIAKTPTSFTPLR